MATSCKGHNSATQPPSQPKASPAHEKTVGLLDIVNDLSWPESSPLCPFFGRSPSLDLHPKNVFFLKGNGLEALESHVRRPDQGVEPAMAQKRPLNTKQGAGIKRGGGQNVGATIMRDVPLEGDGMGLGILTRLQLKTRFSSGQVSRNPQVEYFWGEDYYPPWPC